LGAWEVSDDRQHPDPLGQALVVGACLIAAIFFAFGAACASHAMREQGAQTK